jgi:hypothetical protein
MRGAPQFLLTELFGHRARCIQCGQLIHLGHDFLHDQAQRSHFIIGASGVKPAHRFFHFICDCSHRKYLGP